MSDVFSSVKLDFSSFYKFVSSVGLLLIAAAVALPWFVLRSAAPDAPIGSGAAIVVDEAIDTRAAHYLFIVNVYPWISGVLFLLGLGLTGYGLAAWRRRQKAQDKDEDEAHRQRRELGRTEKASEKDRADKLDREAHEHQPAEADESIDDPRRDVESTAREVRSQDSTRAARDSRYLKRRELIEQVESNVAVLLTTAFHGTHQIETGVRVGRPGTSILDIVARSSVPDRWTSFAVEIRLVDRSPSAAMRLRDAMVAVAIAARDVPEGQVQVQRVGRPPVAKSVSICLLVVSDDEWPAESSLRFNADSFRGRVVSIVDVVNSVLLRKTGVIVVSQTELQDADSDWLKESVLEVMQHPEVAVMRV